MVEGEAGQALMSSGAGPHNLHRTDFGGIAQPKFLAQWRRPKTTAAVYGLVDRSGAGRSRHGYFDSRANGCAVGFCSLELKLEPMIGVARIQEQGAPCFIARQGATQFDENI